MMFAVVLLLATAACTSKPAEAATLNHRKDPCHVPERYQGEYTLQRNDTPAMLTVQDVKVLIDRYTVVGPSGAVASADVVQIPRARCVRSAPTGGEVEYDDGPVQEFRMIFEANDPDVARTRLTAEIFNQTSFNGHINLDDENPEKKEKKDKTVDTWRCFHFKWESKDVLVIRKPKKINNGRCPRDVSRYYGEEVTEYTFTKTPPPSA